MTSSGKAIRRTPRAATIDHRWTAPLEQKLNDQRILKQCCCRFREIGFKTTLKAWYVKRLPTVYCAGPFNWSDAHCAGEKVKEASRTIKRKSYKQQPTRKQATTTRAQPATASRNPPARLPVAQVPIMSFLALCIHCFCFASSGLPSSYLPSPCLRAPICCHKTFLIFVVNHVTKLSVKVWICGVNITHRNIKHLFFFLRCHWISAW